MRITKAGGVIEVKVYVVYENLGKDGFSKPKAVGMSFDDAREWIAGAKLDSRGSYGFDTIEFELGLCDRCGVNDRCDGFALCIDCMDDDGCE